MFAKSKKRIIALTIAMSALVALAMGAQGCSSENAGTCYPGDKVACSCSNGDPGLKECNTAGDGYANCACNESTSSSSSGAGGTGGGAGQGGAAGQGGSGGGASTGGAGGSGSLLPFMAECTMSSQCATMLCFQYNTGPMLCSKQCANDGECPAPSPGCNNMGICKKP